PVKIVWQRLAGVRSDGVQPQSGLPQPLPEAPGVVVRVVLDHQCRCHVSRLSARPAHTGSTSRDRSAEVSCHGRSDSTGHPRLPASHATCAAVTSPPVRRAGSASSATSCRSEEHTSELQSRENLVCRLLLEKKK